MRISLEYEFYKIPILYEPSLRDCKESQNAIFPFQTNIINKLKPLKIYIKFIKFYVKLDFCFQTLKSSHQQKKLKNYFQEIRKWKSFKMSRLCFYAFSLSRRRLRQPLIHSYQKTSEKKTRLSTYDS